MNGNLLKLTSTLFQLIIALCIFGQENSFLKYHDFKSKLNYQDSIGNLDSALMYCDSMISQVNFYPYDYYHGFTIAQQNGDLITANKYLIQGTTKGLKINQWYGKEIDQFFNTKLGQEFWAIQDSLVNIHTQSIDINYYLALEDLKERDQSIRDGSKEMFTNDSIIFEELIVLSRKNGFPTFLNTGYGCNYAKLILWHHRGNEYPNSPQWEKIIPLIQEQINLGLITPRVFEPFEEFATEKER